MAVSDELLIQVKIDTSSGTVAVKDLTVSFDALKKAVDPASEALKKQGLAADKTSLSNTELNSTLELAKKAYSFLITPLQKSIESFLEADKAQKNLMNTLKGLGFDAMGASKDLEEFAKTMQDTTNVSEEFVLQLSSTGKALGLTNKQVKDMIETSLGMSAALGVNVTDAFNQLAGQLNGTSGKAGKFIKGLKDLNEAQMKAGQGIDLAHAQYARFATLAAGTLSGSLEQSKIALGDLYEEVGRTLASLINFPAILTTATSAFVKLTETVTTLGQRLTLVKKGFEEIPFEQTTAAVLALSAAIGGSLIVLNFGAITAGIASMATAFWAALVPVAILTAKFVLIAAAILGVIVLIETIVVNFYKFKVIGQLVISIIGKGMLQLGVIINEVLISIFEGIQKILTPIKGFSSVTDGLLKATSNGIANMTGNVEASADRLKAYTDKIGAAKDAAFSFDNIKTGPVFDGLVAGVNAVKGGFVSLNGEVDKTKTKFNDLSKVPPVGVTPEQIQILEQLKNDTLSLQAASLNVGASQFDIIQRTVEAEQGRLDLKMKQLEAEGKLTEEMVTQFGLQKTAIAEKGAKETKNIGKVDVIPSGTVDAIRNSVGAGAADLAGGISAGMAGFATGAGAVMGAANGVVDFAQQVVDFVPGILNKIADLVNSITDLPQVANKALSGLINAFTRSISDMLPNLITGTMDLFEMIIEMVVEGIPKAFESLMDKLSGIADSIMARIPDLVEKLVKGLITNAARMTSALITFLIADLPRISIALTKILSIEVPKSIVFGLREGAKELVATLKAFFKGVSLDKIIPKDVKDLGKNIGKGLHNLGKGAARESSKLFKVLELEGNAGAIDRIASAEKVKDTIDDSFTNGGKKIESGFQKMIKMLVDGWKAIAKWFRPFTDAVYGVWQKVSDTIVKPWLSVLHATWTFINDTILRPFVDGIKMVWTWVSDYVIGPIVNGIKTAWQGIIDFFSLLFKGKITEAFQSVFDTFLTIGSQIWDGFSNAFKSAPDLFKSLGTNIWTGLYEGVQTLGAFFKNMFDAIQPANLLAKIFKQPPEDKGKVEKALGIDIPFVNFASGGLVAGKSVVSGDSLLNDRVLAMLSPGEAVIPRSKMNDPVVAELVKLVMDGKLSAQNLYPGQSAVEKTVASARGAVTNPIQAAQDIANNIQNTTRPLADRASDLGGQLKSGAGDVWDKFKDVGQDVWDKIAMVDPTVLWAEVEKRVFGGLWKMVENSAGSFHTGGLIPNLANGGDVQATLQPGEYVMRREAVNSLGLGFMDKMNSGKMSGSGSTTINMDVKVNIEASSQSLDESYVRSRLVPALKEELKKASLRGEFLMSNRGLRET